MAAIQRGDVYGTNEYEMDRLGTKAIVSCRGGDLSQYRAENFYSEEQIETYIRDLVKGRKAFTNQIADEGLNPDIIRIAENSFAIAKEEKTKVFVPEQRQSPPEAEEEEDEKFKPYDWSPGDRPLRGKGWRYG